MWEAESQKTSLWGRTHKEIWLTGSMTTGKSQQEANVHCGEKRHEKRLNWHNIKDEFNCSKGQRQIG